MFFFSFIAITASKKKNTHNRTIKIVAYHHQQHIDKNKNIHLGKIIHILFSHLDQATFTSNAKRQLYLFLETERDGTAIDQKKKKKSKAVFLLDYHKNEPLKPFSHSTKILLKDCLN